jgi:hypothetical protein
MKRALVVLGLSAMMAGIAGTTASAAPTTTPFKATASGTTTVTPVDATHFSSASSGTMNSTHLGNGTYTINAQQDWSAADYSGNPPANPCATVTGTVTWTGANGASLSGTMQPGSKTCEAAPFNNTKYNSTLLVAVTGGTGRLAGTTGSVTITGTSVATPTPGTYNDSSTMSGSLNK